MDHETDLVFEYPTANRARTVARAIRREVAEIDDDRSTTSVGREGATVTVAIEAADLVALRAACNTWCSLVETAEKSVDAAERFDRR